jgi:rSAM/selenodomain-associated transferase 1
MGEARIGLGLMCKPPRPGATKTRLARSVGAAQAARLSRAFLMDCAHAARDAAEREGLTTLAFYRPVDAADELAAILGPRWELVHADAGDLGATMREALALLLARCPDGAVLMGADVPLIDGATIAAVARILRDGGTREITLVPSPDGGFCLVGVRCVAAAAPLFAPMAWGGSDVLAETLRRAHAHGLATQLLPAQRDIDDGDDLAWLRSEIEARPGVAPATRAALGEMDRDRSRSGTDARFPADRQGCT